MTSRHTPYDLASVPTELWQDIIERACTDGGSTGRSLILTSKFFHAQANDSRFTSVALFSLDHVERFLAFVRSRPSKWRQPVRHLWLSFIHERFNKRGQGSILLANDDSDEERQTRFTRTMSDLMSLVAPALRTLTLSQSDREDLPSFPLDCPMLTELTVWGNISAVVVHPCSGAPGPYLPALRRFHFVSGKPRARTHLLAPSSWLSTSPLTHLRLSDMDNRDEGEGFANTLARAIGAHVPGSSWSDAVPPQGREIILSHLRYLWIHATEYMGTCVESDTDYGWTVLTPKLQEIMRVAEQEKEMWALTMTKSWRKGKVWERRLWNDWLERMEGGRGCWVESEDEEKALEGPDTCKPYEGGQLWD